MYVLKNPLANEGLESPINRPAYRALDPELQILYRADNGVDEGDDEPTTLPYTEVRDHDEDDDTFEDPASDLGTVAMLTTMDDDSPSEPDINNSDDFGGFSGGSFGGGGATGDWEPDGDPTDNDTPSDSDDNSGGSDNDGGGDSGSDDDNN